MKTWLKDNVPVIGALAGAVLAFVAILQLAIVGPMNRGFDDLRAEINQRFEAVDQRLGDMNRSINQRFDAVDQRFEAVDQRFDEMNRSMTQRFDDMNRTMNQRFDQQDKYINTRFEAVDRRLDQLTGEVSGLRTLVTGIGERVSRNEGRIDLLTEQSQATPVPSP